MSIASLIVEPAAELQFDPLSAEPSPNATARLVLPDGYYLEHFEDFIANIRNTYSDFLSEREKELVRGFAELPLAEKQLFVRLSNRSKVVFLQSSLKYPEIPTLEHTVESLLSRGFLRRAAPHDFTDCLNALTKPLLAKLLAGHTGASSVSLRGMQKSELLRIASELGYDLFERSPTYRELIIREYTEELRYLYFLAFGNVRADLKLYTLRDLGIRRSTGRPSTFSRRFSTEEEARSEYVYRRLREQLRELSAEQLVEQLEAVTLPQPIGRGAIRVRDKLLLEGAQSFLRLKDYEGALRLLSFGTGEQLIERRVRLLHSLGRKNEVESELDSIFQNPVSAGLLFFAEEFSATKLFRKRKSAVTIALEEAKKIRLSGIYRGRPESGVVEHLTEQGHRAFHTENDLFRTLFGILLWDELFEGSDSALFSEFDLIPRDLIDGSFFQRKRRSIEQKVLHNDQTKIRDTIESVFSDRFGTPNALFSWNSAPLELLLDFLEASSNVGADFRTVLLRLAMDFETWKCGFPDLLVFKNGKPSFVEVKALGDRLHPAQLRQLRLLSDCGFETSIIRVEWDYEPNQVYVVVDVETTGIVAWQHRVIEIGALKIRNGEVLDRFSTLLNPECRIPKMITSLTGISQSAVADAPRFSEVAPSFAQFCENAIFVGHNARFDHAFLASEYRRLGRHFSAAILCTAQAMRSVYPNLDSYSLDSLCREFSIPLAQHHRALCDAEATAELLMLLLQQQLAGEPNSASTPHP